MCGIAAIIGKKENTKEKLDLMLQEISHRGEKEHFNESNILNDAAIGMNRLAIVDREKAKQPMKTPDGRYYTVFNGEIYNYQDLKRELESKGYHFSTNSDTEVLVIGYEEWKEKLFDKISGMYAFVIYDNTTREYFAARDPFGVKPLYYAKDKNGTHYFASEIKSLACLDEIKIINLFPPGHYMREGKLFRYWSIPNQIDRNITKEEAVNKIRELFDHAIKIRVQTDLPVAVYLSGGIDSTAVLTTATKFHPNVTAIIVGNEDSTDRQVATRYCQENNIKYIIGTPPSEEELVKTIPKIVRITESFEPNMIRQSAISYYIAKTAADNGFKVILCGEGADELFAGYPEFTKLNSDEEIENRIIAFLSDLHRTQLQRVDRTSMAFTTEVREPFLDKDLANYVLKIPASLKIRKENNQIITKFVLRETMRDRLPEYIYNREKVVLSEGAGYKGNQKIGGLFYDFVSQEISDEELDEYKNKFRAWHLETKEEVYYFKYYLQYHYEKAIFNQQRAMVNKIDTLQEDTKTAQGVLESFNTWKYKREQPATEEKIFQNILGRIKEKKPIEFVMYWGMGEQRPENIIGEHEKNAISFLQEMLQGIKKQYEPGLKLTLVLTDTHAKLNGYSDSEIQNYFKSVKDYVQKDGIETVFLSELAPYNKTNLTSQLDDLHIESELLESLKDSCKKHNKKITDPLFGAKLYFLQNQIEKKEILNKYPNSIFLTYNGSIFNPLLPTALPVFYMYSLEKGTSVKPWFA